MNNKIKRILAFALLALTMISFLSLLSFAEGEGVTVTVSASNASDVTEEEIDGVKKTVVHSQSLSNIISVFGKSDDKSANITLSYVINGVETQANAKYFVYTCESEEDYGTMTVKIFDEEGILLSTYEVELVFDGQGKFFANKWKEFKDDFKKTFIDDKNWMNLLRGLGNTLLITVVSLLMGIVIGVAVAAVRSTYDKNEESYNLRGGFKKHLMKALNGLCKLYLTVIRGTPVVVQLLIMYFIIFAGASGDLLVAFLAFGINSGAYVAEILRGGIMSVDNGQFEAGRSLGFNYFQTMIYIVIPQMFKASLPALCNEFISLLKETSVAGYVPIIELTKAGNIIRSNTYTAFLPLIAVALIYLVMVIILTKLVGVLERRLRKNER